jgi:acetyl esterase/lipase
MGAAIAGGMFATKTPAAEKALAGLRTLCFDPEGEPRAAMLQLHGGGFRIGRPEFEAPLCEALAARCSIAIAVPQYRLAPEAPFPAGLKDAVAALEVLAEEAGDLPLIVGGDSAGAGLAASLGILSANADAPPIAGLVLLSPWLDLTVTAASYEKNAATDPLFSTESAQIAADLYLQGHAADQPLVSPLFADISAYPPCFISVGTGEVLRDDSLAFHEKLRFAGLDSELLAIDGMEHVAVVRDMAATGSQETFNAMTAFIDRILERNPQ